MNREEIIKYDTVWKKRKVKRDRTAKPLPMLDDYVKGTIKAMVDVQKKLTRIKGCEGSIQNSLLREGFNLEGWCLRKIVDDLFSDIQGKPAVQTARKAGIARMG